MKQRKYDGTAGIINIREQDPLKQGLKRYLLLISVVIIRFIREQDPLKQGLKLLYINGINESSGTFVSKIH